jgi:hypothetical protein
MPASLELGGIARVPGAAQCHPDGYVRDRSSARCRSAMIIAPVLAEWVRWDMRPVDPVEIWTPVGV